MKSITITAVTVDYHNEAFARAVCRTKVVMDMLRIPCRTLMITDQAPPWFQGEVKHPSQLWYTNNKFDFNRFLVHGFSDYIDTDLCLTVHDDGYAVNPHRWSDEFLDYDYVGAPWPLWLTALSIKHGPSLRNRVGNGAFAIHSRKFLQWQKQLPPVGDRTADCYICRTCARDARKHGLKIAPLKVACRWSFELPLSWRPSHKLEHSFGFHGTWTKETAALCLSNRKPRWKAGKLVSRINRFLP